MSRLSLTAVAAAVLAATAVPALAAAAPAPLALTIYRSDDSQLYANGAGEIGAGYATVHERRRVHLAGGMQTVAIDGLPTALDAEALNLSFDDAAGVQMLGQRLLWPGNGALGADVGRKLTVFGAGGNTLAQGTLVAAGAGGLTIADPVRGTMLVRDYAAIALPGNQPRSGATLQVSLQTQRAGDAAAQLDYVTAGLGWRAAYTGVMDDSGAECRLRFSADASIGNRSGRDWQDASLKLVAGQPNFAKPSAPRPMMMAKAVAYSEAAPAQASMGDYRSYTLQAPVDLANGSVTQVPLYPSRSVACQRTWLYENGSSWTPPRPMLSRDFNRGGERVSSELSFKAFDALPAGYLRVLGTFGGQREFLGEARIDDTPKGQPVSVTLGQAFDLRGSRERSSFDLDKAAHTLQEGWHIQLSNAGDTARTVTVREHPDRWRNWTLVSSSNKPAKRSTDTIDFKVRVPAHGSGQLDYVIRYQWTADDE
ncbi:MAG TPA: DUF4139 domain-containing protein [Rhodanobacteraceae bacterium]|nr:DUF4139 domain-containing protein [Rhodanobacteraceae bacterium]